MSYQLKGFRKVGACVLSFVLLFGMTANLAAVPALAAPAEESLLAIEGTADIVDKAGNAGMKVLGESLLDGATPTVATTPDLSGPGTAYYIDAENGDDENSGTSEAAAWKSFSVTNATIFRPGDMILLKAGGVWAETTLSPKGSGTAEASIVIGSYGAGAKPRLVGNAQVGELILLTNQQYWEIRDLEISNTAAGFTGTRNTANGGLLGDYRGIRIAGGNSAGVLTGFHLHDLYIHDVTGEVNWISGTATGEAGINHKTGWDKSKRSGGIMIKQWRGDNHQSPEYWASRDNGRGKAPPMTTPTGRPTPTW